jgi:hypothetical protein
MLPTRHGFTQSATRDMTRLHRVVSMVGYHTGSLVWVGLPSLVFDGLSDASSSHGLADTPARRRLGLRLVLPFPFHRPLLRACVVVWLGRSIFAFWWHSAREREATKSGRMLFVHVGI